MLPGLHSLPSHPSYKKDYGSQIMWVNVGQKDSLECLGDSQGRPRECFCSQASETRRHFGDLQKYLPKGGCKGRFPATSLPVTGLHHSVQSILSSSFGLFQNQELGKSSTVDRKNVNISSEELRNSNEKMLLDALRGQNSQFPSQSS